MASTLAPLPGTLRARDPVGAPLALSVLVHGALVAALALVVQWRTQPAAPIAVELWSPVPAPSAPAEPAPRPPEPRAAPPVPAQPDADIALRRERERRDQAQREAARQAELERKAREAARLEKEAAARRAAEAEAERQRLEQARKEEASRAEFRKAMERRMQAQAGGSPAGSSSVRTASGADASYAAAVVACVRPHVVFAVPDGTSPGVYAEFRVDLLPDGSVAGVRLLRPSGLPGYDAAAERAIRRCDPFPRPRDGRIERTIDLRMAPVDTQR